MNGAMPEAGARCVAISCATHETPDGSETLGALQLEWGDGAVTVVDVATDWSLKVSGVPWADPFGGAADEPEWDLGHWQIVPVHEGQPLWIIVGTEAGNIRQSLNDVGELRALEVDFGRARLQVASWGGNLQVTVG
jgi:hypothetical protein